LSPVGNVDLFYPDDGDDQGGDDWEGILPDDAGEDDIQYLREVREVIGSPISKLLTTIGKIEGTREMANLRGLRFGSAYEALRWLFQIGIFHYSKIVDMGGGAWAVAIGTSDPTEDQNADDEKGNDSGLIF
jgi:hypothetical protein